MHLKTKYLEIGSSKQILWQSNIKEVNYLRMHESIVDWTILGEDNIDFIYPLKKVTTKLITKMQIKIVKA